jgi:hypothetical protein
MRRAFRQRIGSGVVALCVAATVLALALASAPATAAPCSLGKCKPTMIQALPAHQ